MGGSGRAVVVAHGRKGTIKACGKTVGFSVDIFIAA
jgi:hypothetical protein